MKRREVVNKKQLTLETQDMSFGLLLTLNNFKHRARSIFVDLEQVIEGRRNTWKELSLQ